MCPFYKSKAVVTDALPVIHPKMSEIHAHEILISCDNPRAEAVP